MAATVATSPARRTGRGRKWGIVLLVLVIVLVGLLVVADRIAAYAAARTIVREAKQQLTAQQITSPKDPTATIGGFPFLTQVVRGKYDKITIDVTQPTAQGVTLDDLTMVATGVNASTSALINGTGQITADNVTGTVRLGWVSVTKLIDLSGYGGQGLEVSALPDGEVQIKAPISMVGLSATVVATGNVTVSGNTAQVKINKVSTEGGQIPPLLQQVIGAIKQQLSFSVKIPALPYNLKVKDATARPEGLTVTAFANNVPLGNQAGA
jgi:hypothetical protein